MGITKLEVTVSYWRAGIINRTIDYLTANIIHRGCYRVDYTEDGTDKRFWYQPGKTSANRRMIQIQDNFRRGGKEEKL